MPLVGLGVMILWIGWFGFNGGSVLDDGTDAVFFGEVMLNTQLGAAAGSLGLDGPKGGEMGASAAGRCEHGVPGLAAAARRRPHVATPLAIMKPQARRSGNSGKIAG
jgi:ammonia channel protein AmtB